LISLKNFGVMVPRTKQHLRGKSRAKNRGKANIRVGEVKLKKKEWAAKHPSTGKHKTDGEGVRGNPTLKRCESVKTTVSTLRRGKRA